MGVKDKILAYIYRKMTELEQEKEQIQYQCRRMPMDSLDHYEVMHQKIRIQAFEEFLNDLYKIVLNCK